MFKFIKSLGRFVVRMYNAEARRLDKTAKAESKLAQELALKARKLSESSIENVNEASKVAYQAQQLSKFFN